MRAGQLRHRVSIQTNSAVQNGFGEPTTSWSETAKAWARVENLQGQELFAAQQLIPEVTTKITMRYRAGMRADMRIVMGSRSFDIKSVLNVEERNRTLELLCIEQPLSTATTASA
jgi:SPP1 family predicted phage head-tail adaptor